MKHDTFKVEHHALALPCLVGIKGFTVPPSSHVLESPATVGLLVPWHLNLKVVRQVEPSPVSIIECRTFGVLHFA